MKGDTYTIFYATTLGVVCSLLLAGVSAVCMPYINANREARKGRSILDALGMPVDDKLSARDVLAAFDEHKVAKAEFGGMEIYIYESSGGPLTAVPFQGQGLWGPIKGFIALEPDRTTIRGVTFYEQQETPGLGGEIGTPDFRQRFRGRKIQAGDTSPGIRIIRGGGATGVNEVDAITGATMTCEKVELMINNAIRTILKEGMENGS